MTDKYDYQSHRRAVKLMAFELWQDVNNGKRNAITFEIIQRPMVFGK